MSRYDQDKGTIVELVGYPGRGELKPSFTPDRFHNTDAESVAHSMDRIIERADEDDRLEMTERQQTWAFYSRQPFDTSQ
jgi:hypothetical protein